MPHLKPIWEAHRHRRLVEPLCGGLAVTLGLLPARALLNDANPHLINFYVRLKRGLHVRLRMENDPDLYAAHRERFNRLISRGDACGRKAAEIFYYLNRTGFNGLCRFNRSGLFNVPFGRYARINYRTDFLAYRKVFAGWEFTNVDLESVPLEPDDFVYADPPYDVPFTQYSKGGFGWEDQVRLARLLARHAGPVVLSNQATERIVRLYTELGFILHRLTAPRRISCTGDRTPAIEVLATRGL